MSQKIQMVKSENLTVQDAYQLFRRNTIVRNLSPETIKMYDYHCNIFMGYVGEDKFIKDVDEDLIDDYVLHLKSNPKMGEITINSYLRSVRTFLNYCSSCNYMKKVKVVMIKCQKPLKPTYTNEELQKLLKKPDVNKCSFSEFKIWAFENYLLGTGNRISSALNLRIEDVNFDEAVIYIRKTKNRKQQVIPISKALDNVLREYLSVRGGCADDFLFCNCFGNQGNIRTYQEAVAEYNIRRGVDKTSCHRFRHTFAKLWILGGGDIFRLQKILGHSSLEVTREYLQMFGQDLQMDFEKFNPLDCLNVNSKNRRISM